MNKGVFGGLTLKELAKRTWREASEDNVFGRAAELAYYFLLALFPMLIFLTSLVGFLPGLREAIMDSLAMIVPADAMKLVRDTLADVTANRSGGLLSFGILATIWAASNGVTALMGTLNVAYGVKETRSFIKTQFTALGLTVALAVLIVGGTALIMFGDTLVDWVSASLGLGATLTVVWHIVDYALGLALLFIGIGLIYYIGPNVKQKWRWITPGSVSAVAATIASSMLFSLYLRYAPKYSATYGSLGAVIILMLWLYLVGLVLLIGGEINSEIEIARGVIPAEKKQCDHLQAA
jgi:membrane protein